ncbi:hypothetical protein PPYR_06677 [Photinus pyralis]|uniref:Ribosome biogenesis protein BRX1 homolog n=1 Tax=Photinus pyralis TaxID=7054 RepID=A0A5N4AN94_PHOPY|nr:ribosome biogenesis protein BRX1 homolog [Photinus pyralis]KAB0798797.1 hypothetical protein PPYR_06677 [Photinus pyralis]
MQNPKAKRLKKSTSQEPPLKKKHWTNKQRVLIFCSRGMNFRYRHLMQDLKTLIPHHRAEPKMERAKTLSIVNDMCEVKNCNKALMFEGRRKLDLYMWLSNIADGPSVKFAVDNIHTMGELKLTGNCLKGSRPLLSFDPKFSESPHYSLLKELFIQIFGVPDKHPKSQPFFDHVYTFTILDDRIWFRNFQILSEDGALTEIGPRFVLNPVKIFASSFGGLPLWENPKYVSPAKYRRHMQLSLKKDKYMSKKQQKLRAEANKPTKSYDLNPLDDVFKQLPTDDDVVV